MNVVVLDAYRRSNSGDGLLVDEAIGLIHEAYPEARITLISMEPSSFPEYGTGLHPVAGKRERMRPLDLLARLLTARPHSTVSRAISGADLAVAVGGGYIRADRLSAAAKAYLSHVVQAPTRRNTTPYVYLPQSIGPLPPRLVPFGVRRLRRAHAVFVRDDRSHAELARHGVASTRMPDLAAIAIGASPLAPRNAVEGSSPALIARALIGGSKKYERRLHELVRLIEPEMLVQSSGAGNDDRAFYRAQGWGATNRSALDALRSPSRPSVVASVRLHGALQSILTGVPAVHLSYERKGWGAFEDLGISEYVHSARNFDPRLVAKQVQRLIDDPTAYWDAIGRRRPALAAARTEIVRSLKEATPRHSRSSARQGES